MKLRFKRAWQTYSKGAVIEPISAAFAETLIKSNICEEVKTLTLKKRKNKNDS